MIRGCALSNCHICMIICTKKVGQWPGYLQNIWQSVCCLQVLKWLMSLNLEWKMHQTIISIIQTVARERDREVMLAPK